MDDESNKVNTMSSNKNHPIRLARFATLTILVVTGVLYWVSKGFIALQNQRYEDAVPPSSIQTIHDFLQWQTEIRLCREVDVRGVTYFHVIGSDARAFSSGGALYVFDANGNYVGWSRDSGDVMRNEGVFYPRWWLPQSSSVTDISLDELKGRIPNEAEMQTLSTTGEITNREE